MDRMCRALFIGLLVGPLSFAVASQGKKVQTLNFRPTIVGGQDAAKGEFPFIVSLQDSSGHFCGGSLIREDWVLTAGHCVEGTSIDKVVIGLVNQDDMSGTEVMTVKKIIQHPQFSMNTVDYDFALIQLNKKSHFKPIDPSKTEMKMGASNQKAPLFTAAGWGTLQENSFSISNKLQKVEVPLVDSTVCKEVYKGFNEVTDRMLCAGLDKGTKDSCQGDSGGPLILREASGTYSLVGLVSWGKGCAEAKAYGVYSRISWAYDWIQKSMQ